MPARRRPLGDVVLQQDAVVNFPDTVEFELGEVLDEPLAVEGGGEIIYSLFAADLVDRLSVFVGSLVVGGRDAPTLADGEGFVDPAAFPALNLVGVERLGEGVVLRWQA